MTWLRLIPETTNIDFVGARYYAFAVDGLLVLISVVSICALGGAGRVLAVHPVGQDDVNRLDAGQRPGRSYSSDPQ